MSLHRIALVLVASMSLLWGAVTVPAQAADPDVTIDLRFDKYGYVQASWPSPPVSDRYWMRGLNLVNPQGERFPLTPYDQPGSFTTTYPATKGLWALEVEYQSYWDFTIRTTLAVSAYAPENPESKVDSVQIVSMRESRTSADFTDVTVKALTSDLLPGETLEFCAVENPEQSRDSAPISPCTRTTTDTATFHLNTATSFTFTAGTYSDMGVGPVVAAPGGYLPIVGTDLADPTHATTMQRKSTSLSATTRNRRVTFTLTPKFRPLTLSKHSRTHHRFTALRVVKKKTVHLAPGRYKAVAPATARYAKATSVFQVRGA